MPEIDNGTAKLNTSARLSFECALTRTVIFQEYKQYRRQAEITQGILCIRLD